MHTRANSDLIVDTQHTDSRQFRLQTRSISNKSALLPLTQWHSDSKDTTAAFNGMQRHFMAQQATNSLHNRKPETKALFSIIVIKPLTAFKLIKHPLLIERRYTWPGIPYLN